MTDADKNYFDGAKTYKADLAKNIPEANFWSFTLYDNITRSMLDTHSAIRVQAARATVARRQNQSADGSTTIYFGPTQPTGIKRGNWVQTDPKKGWFTILRLQPVRTVLYQRVARAGSELVR
jgi:hypothetical protein